MITRTKSNYSSMTVIRIFGIDFMFGYIKIKDCAETADKYGTQAVNPELKRSRKK